MRDDGGDRSATAIDRIAGAAACLLVAALATGLTSAPATADELDQMFERILANPRDVEANLAYARAAEARGELRKALTTYERVLQLDPGQPEASEGLWRIRRLLEPASTTIVVEAGVGYESNPTEQSQPRFYEESGSVFAAARLRDERRMGEYRWRSDVAGYGIWYPDADTVNNAGVDASFGPLIPVGDGAYSVRPAVVGSLEWLDQSFLYGEAGASLSFEGRFAGAMQAIELRGVWRGYGSRWASDSGPVIDLLGHVAVAGLVAENDTLAIRPRLRWSGVDGKSLAGVPTEFEPGNYIELGARIDYNVRLLDWLVAGAHVGLYERWFSAAAAPGRSDREDTFFAPGASLTFTNLISYSTDFKVDYTYQRQLSNAPGRTFTDNIVTGRVIARF
jgi:tetratricopeptide (TPR) repeat protein